MKKRCCIGIMLTLSIMIVALPTMAGVEVTNFMGQTAQAEISSTDECLFTNVAVMAFERSFNLPGTESLPSQIQVIISQLDTCTETLLLVVGFALLEDQEFQTSKLDSATLSKNMEVFDLTSETVFQVKIDLTWSGIGPINRGNFHHHSQLEDCIINIHSNGTDRAAQVSGSVSDGTTNFTPDPSFNAFLSNSKDGSVEVNCGPE